MESQHERSPSALPPNAFTPRGFQLQCHQDIHKLFLWSEPKLCVCSVSGLCCVCGWSFSASSCCDIWVEEATFLSDSIAEVWTASSISYSHPAKPLSLSVWRKIADSDQYQVDKSLWSSDQKPLLISQCSWSKVGASSQNIFALRFHY